MTRLVPLSGIAAVVLIIAGSGAAGATPRPDAPVGKLVSFYTSHNTGQVTSGVLLSLGAILFLVFSAALVEALHSADVNARTASTLCLAGALVFAAGMALLGAGAATLQTKLFPEWLGWIAIALGAAAAIPSHVLGGLLDHVGVIPVAGLGIWMLIVSVLLYVTPSPPLPTRPSLRASSDRSPA